MRILHVNTERGWRGGERQVALLIESQTRAGDSPHLFARLNETLAARVAHSTAQSRREVQVASGQNPSPNPSDTPQRIVDITSARIRSPWHPQTIAALRTCITGQDFDILHLHTANAHTLGLLASLGLSIPVVIHRRVDFPVGTSTVSRLKYCLKSVHYIAISHAISRVLEAGGIPPHRISVIHSAVPEPETLPEGRLETLHQSLQIRGKGPLLGTVGALVDHKGYRYLLEAFPQVLQQFPSAQLILIGDGPLRQALQKQAQERRISEHVHFLGERPDAHALQQLLDVFVVPSHLEGLNTAMLDAFWLQRPVVASRAGGIPEALAPGCGWLVPPKDSGSLAAALIEVLQNPDIARERVVRARAHVEAHFSLERMVTETRQVYLDVIRRSTR